MPCVPMLLLAAILGLTLLTRAPDAALGASSGMSSGASHAGHAGHQGATADAGKTATPIESGQSAFAAIQEIVALLEADPTTDWSKVNIRALREHLVDMDELVLRADVDEKRLPGGFEAVARGNERTLEAIRRMIPAHAKMLDGHRGWRVQAESVDKGAKLRVTSGDSEEAARIQALGFFGVMASGAHHQAHHLAIAKGANVH